MSSSVRPRVSQVWRKEAADPGSDASPTKVKGESGEEEAPVMRSGTGAEDAPGIGGEEMAVEVEGGRKVQEAASVGGPGMWRE